MWAGQICVAASRVLVHQSRLSAFRDAMKSILENLVVGPSRDSASQMGPVIDIPNRSIRLAISVL